MNNVIVLYHAGRRSGEKNYPDSVLPPSTCVDCSGVVWDPNVSLCCKEERSLLLLLQK